MHLNNLSEIHVTESTDNHSYPSNDANEFSLKTKVLEQIKLVSEKENFASRLNIAKKENFASQPIALERERPNSILNEANQILLGSAKYSVDKNKKSDTKKNKLVEEDDVNNTPHPLIALANNNFTQNKEKLAEKKAYQINSVSEVKLNYSTLEKSNLTIESQLSKKNIFSKTEGKELNLNTLSLDKSSVPPLKMQTLNNTEGKGNSASISDNHVFNGLKIQENTFNKIPVHSFDHETSDQIKDSEGHNKLLALSDALLQFSQQKSMPENFDISHNHISAKQPNTHFSDDSFQNILKLDGQKIGQESQIAKDDVKLTYHFNSGQSGDKVDLNISKQRILGVASNEFTSRALTSVPPPSNLPPISIDVAGNHFQQNSFSQQHGQNQQQPNHEDNQIIFDEKEEQRRKQFVNQDNEIEEI